MSIEGCEEEEAGGIELNIYLWLNGSSESDFTDKMNIAMPGSNAHSGGIVVLAEDEEEARKLATEHIGLDPLECHGLDEFDMVEVEDTKPIVINLDKKGVVIFDDGAC